MSCPSGHSSGKAAVIEGVGRFAGETPPRCRRPGQVHHDET